MSQQENGKSPILYNFEKQLPRLTSAEKKATEYIIQNPEKVIGFSIAALAEAAGVSEPTIVRTCRSLGYNGYQNFKIALAQDIVKPQQFVNENLSADDNMQDILRKVFNGTIQTLNFTHESLNWKDVERAAKLITSAGKIHIFGVGASGSLAMDLYHKLIRLDICAYAYTDAHLQAICAAHAKKGDVIFAISHSGSSKIVVDNARIAKNNGADLITLTSIGKSPLSKLADISLYTVSDETNYRLLSISSRHAGLAIIDSIYTYIAMQTNEIQAMKVEQAMQPLKY